MEPITFWNTYVQDIPPADFVWRYGRGNFKAAVHEYLQQYPNFLGIVRRSTWKDTFRAEKQYNRSCVSMALLSYLEETEEIWRPQVEAARQTEAKAKAEAKARAESEALALAVARVEAEARARLEAERLKALNPEPLQGDTVPAGDMAETPPSEESPAAEPSPSLEYCSETASGEDVVAEAAISAPVSAVVQDSDSGTASSPESQETMTVLALDEVPADGGPEDMLSEQQTVIPLGISEITAAPEPVPGDAALVQPQHELWTAKQEEALISAINDVEVDETEDAPPARLSPMNFLDEGDVSEPPAPPH